MPFNGEVDNRQGFLNGRRLGIELDRLFVSLCRFKRTLFKFPKDPASK